MSSSSAPLPGTLATSPSSTSSVQASASPVETAAPSRARVECQYPQCSRPAKYGPRNGPPSACQAHKRTGQYTMNRQGDVMIATRDGDAFRTEAAPQEVASSSPTPSTGTPVPAQAPATSDRPREPSAEGSEIPASSPDSGTGRMSPPSAETPARASEPLSGQADLGENRSGPSSGRVDPGENQSGPSSGQVTSGENQSGPSSGQVTSGENQAGPSTGQVDRSPTSNNRQCLFPGCKSSPKYGLPGAARAVYCSSHKKGVMVLVSREASDLQSNSETPNVASPVAPRMTIAGTPNSQAPSARAVRSGNKKKARKLIIKRERGAKKARHGPMSRGTDGATHNNGRNEADGITGGITGGIDAEDAPVAESGLTPTVSDSAAIAAPKTPSPLTTVSGSPPANRKADAAGMAPSTEILRVRQAREAAKMEAEAAGGGKRARAPSRRVLEASGRMTDDGAQWMTRERREEEVRFNTELREQRKQYKAAGLQFGVVLEAFVPKALASGATGSGEGGGVATGVGIDGGSGGEAAAPRSGAGWHKVSPALPSAPALPTQTTELSDSTATSAGEMIGKQATPTAAANSA